MRTEVPFAVLFDMDGVLIDSVLLHWQAYNEVLGRYGVHVSQEDLHRYVGRNQDDQIRQLQADRGLQLSPEAFEQQVAPLKEALFKHVQPKPGVMALLEALQHAGVPMAVATSSSLEATQDRLQKAGIIAYFSAVVTAEDVAEHKPHPAVYLAAAAHLALPAAQCIVIEDAPAGIAAARAAGMACVAVQTAYTLPEQLAAAQLVVPTLEAVLPEQLQALLAKPTT